MFEDSQKQNIGERKSCFFNVVKSFIEKWRIITQSSWLKEAFSLLFTCYVCFIPSDKPERDISNNFTNVCLGLMCSMAPGLSMNIQCHIHHALSTHKSLIRHQTTMKCAVSLEIAEGHFSFPQAFVWEPLGVTCSLYYPDGTLEKNVKIFIQRN